MKEESGGLLSGAEKGVRRHQSMQRLTLDQNGGDHHHQSRYGGHHQQQQQQQAHHHHGGQNSMDNASSVVPDHRGNLHITVTKTKPILGIAIEGGANTKHPLPRIINIHEHGAAYEAGGLEVGQLILEVDGQKVEGMHHQVGSGRRAGYRRDWPLNGSLSLVSGGGSYDCRMLCEPRQARHYVLGGGGEEIEYGAETDRAHLPGSLTFTSSAG